MNEVTLEKIACSVREGSFVDPCDMLRLVDESEGPFSKKKGIYRWQLSSIRPEGAGPSRSFFGVKTKARPNGVAFNFCPFCGEKIDAPFSCEEESSHE